jgi:hypothetical protein
MRSTAPIPGAATRGLLLACALAFGLVGCGDKPADGPVTGPGGPSSGMPSGVAEDAAARFKAALEESARLGGGSMPPGAAKEFSSRLKEALESRVKDGRPAGLPLALETLKPADVELWLKLAPTVNKLGGDIPALTKAVEAEGLTTMQWVMLQSRVTGTAMGLKMGNLPEPLKENAGVVTPYLDRILSTLGMR